MKMFSKLMILFLLMTFSAASAQTSIFDFTVKDYEGNDYPLRQDSGKVMLIVNTVTQCASRHSISNWKAFTRNTKTKASSSSIFHATNSTSKLPAHPNKSTHSVRANTRLASRKWTK